jgi:hypothetical protein
MSPVEQSATPFHIRVYFRDSWNRAAQYKSGTSRTHANVSVPTPAPPTTQTSISKYQIAVNAFIQLIDKAWQRSPSPSLSPLLAP